MSDSEGGGEVRSRAALNGRGSFGTAPVFLTAISTILGAVMFLRFGYAVGHVGFVGTVGIILLGHLVTIPTAMALAEIATNQKVAGGGEYFIISRSFGHLIGASIGLLWVRPNFEKVLKEVHWDVLLFFIALFIIVGGLEASGVIGTIGNGILFLANKGIYLAMIVILWVGALASGVISNVPFTIAFLPILKGLAAQGIDVNPLWWALALGVGFGANLTPLGSAANVIVLSLSDSIGERLSFRRWLGTGTWVGLASCAAATVALLVASWIGLI